MAPRSNARAAVARRWRLVSPVRGAERVRRGRIRLLWLVLWAAAFAGQAAAQGQGTISGRVFDGESGAALENATVILAFPDPGDGSPPRQEIATSGPAGDYEFDAVPAGFYALSFVKSGYRASSITNFEVLAGQDNVADFPMPPQVRSATGEVLELDAFVVEAGLAGELMNNLELRLESDQSINLLSAEDLSRYAASDVADALKRVAGVNVVEGQFAIIRGLEDRYSSTMFNGAPIPSPDPDSQSVQLDLFPSDVVTNLVVAKTFAAESPSNSSGGSIDIVTLDYPEEVSFKLSLGAGFEEDSLQQFLEFRSGSTVGTDAREDIDVLETDYTGSLGGHVPVFGRDVRFKAVVNHEVDYRTQVGFQESREPIRREEGFQTPPIVTRSGGLAFGELALSDGFFDQIQSTREEQLTAYGAVGIDLDAEGRHRVDASYFFTRKNEETVEQRSNGYFTDLDYSGLVQATIDEELEEVLPFAYVGIGTNGSRLANSGVRLEISDAPSRGAPWFASFGRSNAFEVERDLSVYQMNGEHEFDVLDGLDVSWVANHATTQQDQTSLGMRFFYEPCGYSGQVRCPAGVSPIPVPSRFPARVQDLGPGTYFASGDQDGIVFSETKIDESQWFGRFDLDQEVEPLDFVRLSFKAGVWWEKARRGVDALYVETVTVNGSSQWALGSSTLPELGGSLFSRFDAARGDRFSTTRAKREITAGHLSLKSTLWEDLDVLAGVRLEQIFIDSRNDPFTGETAFGRPSIFPVAYLYLDRLDNPNPPFFEVGAPLDPATARFNDQILGIDVPIDPNTGLVDLFTESQIRQFVNGEIDEFKALPSVGFVYRPLEGLTLRAGYSETVSRPSFREMGYYVTVEPGTDEQTVGNPQLQLSEVQSYDARVEYVYGDLGDLFAFSAFYKVIDDPIESIVVRDEVNQDGGSTALFRTFFNNPNTARLWGIEVEARKSFDFLGRLGDRIPFFDAFDYLSIGGNFTYIDARVDRTQAELSRAGRFFGTRANETGPFAGLEPSRRLFGQPEWIANGDVSFDHPDWGTTVTLAVFAISDVLDAAGSVEVGTLRGIAEAITLDRYTDKFYQLDFVASQRIWKGLKAKMSVKNLTNTSRKRFYDREQTNRKYIERSRRSGRDWSFSLSYTIEY